MAGIRQKILGRVQEQLGLLWAAGWLPCARSWEEPQVQPLLVARCACGQSCPPKVHSCWLPLRTKLLLGSVCACASVQAGLRRQQRRKP